MSRGTYIECDVCRKLVKDQFPNKKDLREWSILKVPTFDLGEGLHHEGYEVCSLECARKILELAQDALFRHKRFQKIEESRDSIIRELRKTTPTFPHYENLVYIKSYLQSLAERNGWAGVAEDVKMQPEGRVIQTFRIYADEDFNISIEEGGIDAHYQVYVQVNVDLVEKETTIKCTDELSSEKED